MKSTLFSDWVRDHPDLPFSAFYTWDVERQLRSGKLHSTLSTSAPAASAGLDIFEKLKLYGLTNDAVCVDYGCGTLRVGRHVIGFLPAEAYCGLDISSYLLDHGRRLLEPALLAEKRPRLRLTSEDNISQIASLRPDFIFSNAVLMHVHPQEVAAYLKNIVTLTGQHGQAVLSVKCSPVTVQYSERSWCHSFVRLQSMLAALRARVEVLQADTVAVPGTDYAKRIWLKVTLRDATRDWRFPV